MPKAGKQIEWDGPEVARIRRVRAQIAKEFGSFDALFDHWVALDRKRKKKEKAKRTAKTK